MQQMSNVFLFIIGAKVHPEFSDVSELLGSDPSRVLPLAYARACCCRFSVWGLSRWSGKEKNKHFLLFSVHYASAFENCVMKLIFRIKWRANMIILISFRILILSV
jgi:hypothetical protein